MWMTGSVGNMGASSKMGLSAGWLVGVCSSSESEFVGAQYLLLEMVVVLTGLKLGCCGSVVCQYLRPSLLSGKIWRLSHVK